MLGEAFLGFAFKNGMAYANAALVDKFNEELPGRCARTRSVEVPGDILLVGRVMGLLSGISKQLGSEVDPTALCYRISRPRSPAGTA